MSAERFVVVDVGCIECGEQTEVVGVFDTMEDAEKAFEGHCEAVGVEEWKPRGGFLETLGLRGADTSTYIGGTGYFAGGQHAIELHVLPARKVPDASE